MICFILGLDPKTMIDLTELKNSKALKQQQYKAENQILLKEASNIFHLMLFIKIKNKKQRNNAI